MVPSARVTAIFLAMLLSQEIFGQPQLPLPQASPEAAVKQTIGIAEVAVAYHRPGVKERTIWGRLVPYGEVWRAGANENTTVTFSHPVTIEGAFLPAGTYGIHMIPTREQWTVIFSKNATSWGSFHYDQSEDALRAVVTPQVSSHTERLTYEFTDLTDSSAVLSLLWEKLRVPIRISLNMKEIVVEYIRKTFLRGLAGFFWQGYNQAAAYCLQERVYLEEALTWVDRSIGMNENFTNLRTKAGILEAMGKLSDATGLRARSIELATEADINLLGYQHLNEGRTEEAIKVFEKNVEKYADSWNVYDSLAEGLERKGDVGGAIRYYERALSMVKSNTQRERINRVLKRLKGGS